MFKKLFLAFLICLFSIGISNAEWKIDFEGKPDGLGRTIVKAWYNKYDKLLIIFYDEDNDGKLDKIHHVHFMGRCLGDKTIGIDTTNEVKTADDLIKILEEREKIQNKEAKEKRLKELSKDAI